MIPLGFFLVWVAAVLASFAWIYFWIVVISVVMSWVRADPWNPIVRFFRTMTEPPCDWIRRKFPFVVVGMIDLSPIVLILGVKFIEGVVVPSLRAYGRSLL